MSVQVTADLYKLRHAVVSRKDVYAIGISEAFLVALIDAGILVSRLAEWDSLNPPLPGDRYGDAPYWKRELDAAVAALGPKGDE